MASPKNTHGSKPTRTSSAVPGDDFRVYDADVTDGVSDGTDTTAITAATGEDENFRAPARFEENFDEALAPARSFDPNLTIVHGVGEYKNTHDVGRLVLGSLERAVDLTKTTLNRVKSPEQARKEARIKIIVIAVSTPVYQPDVKPDHPGFKIEVESGEKIKEGEFAGQFAHEVTIRKMGGTLDRREAKARGLQLFLPKSEVMLLIEKPDHVEAEFADFFPFVLDGKNYAKARYFAKKTAFTHFVETGRSLRKSNPRLMAWTEADGTKTKGRWYGAPFLLGVDVVEPKVKGGNSFYIPDLVNCSDEIGTETLAFCKEADPIPR